MRMTLSDKEHDDLESEIVEHLKRNGKISYTLNHETGIGDKKWNLEERKTMGMLSEIDNIEYSKFKDRSGEVKFLPFDIISRCCQITGEIKHTNFEFSEFAMFRYKGALVPVHQAKTLNYLNRSGFIAYRDKTNRIYRIYVGKLFALVARGIAHELWADGRKCYSVPCGYWDLIYFES